jgi:cytochrome c-type biogenesis protein CcmH
VKAVGVVLATLAALSLAAPAVASEERPTLRELEAEVMCPTCNTLLETSDAPVAERMRVYIRSRIAAGDSKSEIKERLVAQFGEAVLASPRRRGLGLLAWLAPAAALLAGGLVLAWRGRRTARLDVDAEPAPLDDETEEAIALALAEANR